MKLKQKYIIERNSDSTYSLKEYDKNDKLTFQIEVIPYLYYLEQMISITKDNIPQIRKQPFNK